MANDDFSEPPRRADSNDPIFIFCRFWVRVTYEAQGSVLVGFWGSRQLSPFWGRGGGLARGLYRPPPLNCKPGCPRGVLGLAVQTISCIPHRLPRPHRLWQVAPQGCLPWGVGGVCAMQIQQWHTQEDVPTRRRQAPTLPPAKPWATLEVFSFQYPALYTPMTPFTTHCSLEVANG